MNPVMWMFSSESDAIESDLTLMNENRCEIAEFGKVAEKILALGIPTDSFNKLACHMKELTIKSKVGRVADDMVQYSALH